MIGIEGITPRVQEVGRIRMGDKNDRGLPVSLSTFRLTSYDKTVLDDAAEIYGGTVQAWTDAPDPGMYELVTAAKALDILIPRSLRSVSQSWELWKGGVCERRCDGRVEEISGSPCICGPARGESDEMCDVVTRLSVILPRLPGLGVWRLDTGGYFAATTIPSTLELLMALDQRAMVPATLRAVERSSRIRDQAGKVLTRRFVTPVLDAPGITIGQLVEAAPALPETVERPRPLTAEERVAARAAALREAQTAPATTPEPAEGASVGQPPSAPEPVAQATGEAGTPTPAAPVHDPDARPCGRQDPMEEERCVLPMGHEGRHEGPTLVGKDHGAYWRA